MRELLKRVPPLRFLVRFQRRVRGRLRMRLVLGLGRRTPVSRAFGWDRGMAIDRVYIERFLERHANDIHGTVLEIEDPAYTRRFGGDKVTRSEVLHAVEGNPQATFVGDLETGENIPKDHYDCIILTETLYLLGDMRAALEHARDALRGGGVLLVTSGFLMPIDIEIRPVWEDRWRFSADGARWLFGQVFGPENVAVEQHGNVLTASAFLYGLAAEDLPRGAFDYDDEERQFPVTVSVRAQKA
jgi:SAM-dependent methyltransferase